MKSGNLLDLSTLEILMFVDGVILIYQGIYCCTKVCNLHVLRTIRIVIQPESSGWDGVSLLVPHSCNSQKNDIFVLSADSSWLVLSDEKWEFVGLVQFGYIGGHRWPISC